MGLNPDQRDLKILEILQENGRISKAELAERINLSPTAGWERLKRLEKAGLISGYKADIALDKIVPYSTFLVQIELENHRAVDFKRFEHAIQKTPAVTKCLAVGGGVDYFLEIVAVDVERYQQLMDQLLDSNIGVKRYFTFIVTKPVKSSPAPVAELLQQAQQLPAIPDEDN